MDLKRKTPRMHYVFLHWTHHTDDKKIIITKTSFKERNITNWLTKLSLINFLWILFLGIFFFMMLAFRLNQEINWSWKSVFFPIWIAFISIGCEMGVLIWTHRTHNTAYHNIGGIPWELRRASKTIRMACVLSIVLSLIFFIVLSGKLDGAAYNWGAIFSPLWVLVICQTIGVFVVDRGSKYFVGFTIVSICPLLLTFMLSLKWEDSADISVQSEIPRASWWTILIPLWVFDTICILLVSAAIIIKRIRVKRRKWELESIGLVGVLSMIVGASISQLLVCLIAQQILWTSFHWIFLPIYLSGSLFIIIMGTVLFQLWEVRFRNLDLKNLMNGGWDV